MTDLVLYLYWHELMSMPEYSTTLPTATTVGKVWRRRGGGCGLYDVKEWLVGLYAFDYPPRVVWFRVVPKHGPAPSGYRAPDWTNYEGWKRKRNEERRSA